MAIDRILAIVGIALTCVGIGVPIAFPHLKPVVGWLFLASGVGIFTTVATHYVLGRRVGPTRDDWHEMERRFDLIES
jgi:hypothetical protein